MDEVSCPEICKKAFRDIKGKWGFSIFIHGLCLFFCAAYFVLIYRWAKYNPELPRLVPLIVFGYCLMTLPPGLYACHLDIARNNRLDVMRLFFFLKRPLLLLRVIWLQKVLLRLPLNEILVPESIIWFIMVDHPEYSASKLVFESRAIIYGHRISLFKVYVMSMFVPCVFLVALAELYESIRFDKPLPTPAPNL